MKLDESLQNVNSIETDFVIRPESERISKILNEYDIKDSFMSAFCLNSWRYNRPHISFYLTFNDALKQTKKFGTKKIKTYDDFLVFVNKIIENFKIFYNDEIVCDFGEIKIPFRSNFYPVFVGTGHNFTIPFYMSLDFLSKELKIENEMEQVLQYSLTMVNKFQNVECFDSSKLKIDGISIPNESYFAYVRENYESIRISEDSFLQKLSNLMQNNISLTHFIFDVEQFYPIFNPSIIIDSFDLLYKKIHISNDKVASISDNLLIHSLIINFELSNDKKKILPFPGFLEDGNNSILIGNRYFNLAVICNRKIIVFINGSEIKDLELKKIISAINDKVNYSLNLIVPDKYPRHRCINVTNYKIKFVVYDGDLNLGMSSIKEYKNEYENIYIYDLISISYQAENIENFVDFFFLDSNHIINSMSFFNGRSSLFDAWQIKNKELSQGALNFNFIMTDIYGIEWKCFDLFRNIEKWYPLDEYYEMFSNPFNWIHIENVHGYNYIFSKAAFGFGGAIKRIKNSFLFLAFNMTFEDKNDLLNIRHETIKLVEEMTERLFDEFEEVIYECILKKYNFLQITYMPTKYAKSVDENGFTKLNRKYVYSDSFIDGSKCLIRYAINEKKLFHDILDARDKEIECIFFQELLECLKNNPLIEYDKIIKEVLSHIHDKKSIEAIAIDLKYVFSNKNLGQWPDTKSFVKVRKNIACKCKETNINPGTYDFKKATSIVRDIQKLIIPDFENIISEFDKYELHKILVSIVSYYYHQKRMDSKRFDITDSNYLSEEAKIISSKNIIENREESKHKIRVLNYLIDTNLAIKHSGNKKTGDLNYLIAYSNWLIVLQDCADECYYGLFDVKLEIEDDYKVNTLYPEEHEKYVTKKNFRIYNNEDYIPIIEDYNDKFNDSLRSFKEDTGIDLVNIIQSCIYLSKEFSAVFKETVLPDVYEIGYDELINDYISILKDKSPENTLKIIKSLEYLIINEDNIKSISGDKTEFIPIWDRENRTERFEVKPIIKNGNNLIFSPVVMYELAIIWNAGTNQFYPPYEYGLEHYIKSLEKWKSACEKQMEKDLEQLFNKKGFITKRSLRLHKFDKNYEHPIELGDYDVISIDTNNKIVWNIESKFLGKVGSIREYYNHQDSFFNKDKKDEKFNRRITYLNSHIKQILSLFGIENSENYKIESYMVTNKVFTSDIKKINFEIITFCELKSKLNA